MEQLEARIAYLEAAVRVQSKTIAFALELLGDSDKKLLDQRIKDYAATETAAFAAGVAECLKD